MWTSRKKVPARTPVAKGSPVDIPGTRHMLQGKTASCCWMRPIYLFAQKWSSSRIISAPGDMLNHYLVLPCLQ